MVFRSTAVRKREQRRFRKASTGRPGWRVRVSGVRDSVGVVRCPSYCSLERWWPNRSRQPDLVVRSSPPDDAPHGVAGGDRTGSKDGVLSTDVDRSVSTADRREQPTHSGVNRDNRIHQHRGRTMPRCWCTFLVRSQPLKSQPLKSQPLRSRPFARERQWQKGIQRQSLVTAPRTADTARRDAY